MPPASVLSAPPDAESILCWLAVETDDGLVYIDVQDSRPAGTIVAPSVLDLEIYEPGGPAAFAWIYFKGDTWNGPTSGHPVDAPFNDGTLFSLNLVKANDTSTIIRNVMSLTNNTLFWKGFGPAHESNGHMISLQRFGPDCKYQYVASMIYLWEVPKDLDGSVLRLQLTTDEPSSTYTSGRLQISNTTQGTLTTASPSSSLADATRVQSQWRNDHELEVSAIGVLIVLLAVWTIVRLRSRAKQVALA
ncbi:hypothetical protein LTR95_011605 [Oleoguttula sp. CCFEE 5521]